MQAGKQEPAQQPKEQPPSDKEKEEVLSVAGLILALALSCIIITGTICTVLTVTSGNSGLDDTKEASAKGQRDSEAQCQSALETTRTTDRAAVVQSFDSAEVAIIQRTRDLIRVAAGVTASTVRQQLDYYTKLTMSWYEFGRIHSKVQSQFGPGRQTNTLAYIKDRLPELYGIVKVGRAVGHTRGTLMTAQGDMVTVYENYETMMNDHVDGYHEIMSASAPHNDWLLAGTAMGTPMGGTLNMTHDPDLDSMLPGRNAYESANCRPGWRSPITGQPCLISAMQGCRDDAPMGNQTHPRNTGACYINERPQSLPLYTLFRDYIPVGQTRWTPMILNGPFLSMSAIVAWGNTFTGQKYGGCAMTLSIRALDRLVKRIEVGGPGARSRIALMRAGKSWLHDLTSSVEEDADWMVAVTHGNATSWVVDDNVPGGWKQAGRKVWNAQDPLIRAGARYIRDTIDGGFTTLDGDVTSFTMNTAHAGGGEIEMLPGPIDNSTFPEPPPRRFTGPFEGRLQYINGRANPEEAMASPLPGYASEGELFYVTAASMTTLYSRGEYHPARQDDGLEGLKGFNLMILIDRDFVLGITQQFRTGIVTNMTNDLARIQQDVDSNLAVVNMRRTKSEEDVQDTLYMDRIGLFVGLSVTFVLLIVVAVFMTGKIVGPVRELELDMAEVALMKTEGKAEYHEENESSLEEVSKMQASFVQMIKNLKDFRSYMPASALLGADESDSEDEETTQGSKTDAGTVRSSMAQSIASLRSQGQGSKAPSRKLSRAVSKDSSGALSRSARSFGSTKKSIGTAKMMARTGPGALALGVNKKACGVAVCNVRNFVDIFKHTEKPTDVHALYITGLIKCVKACKGLPDSFNGDRFYASFNAAKPTPGAKAAAGRCALLFSELEVIIKEVKDQDGGKKIHADAGAISTAAAGGDVQCGNMGIDGMKKFCLIGMPQSFVHVLEHHNRLMETKVMIDLKVKADVEQSHKLRQMLPIEYKKGTQRAYELLELRDMGEDEWMYQLEEAAAEDKGKTISEAIDLFAQGDHEGAMKKLKDDPEQTRQHAIIMEYISTRMGSLSSPSQ